jgi:hypothetical protein
LGLLREKGARNARNASLRKIAFISQRQNNANIMPKFIAANFILKFILDNITKCF